MLLRVGDFSKKANIPIRTLRFYDEIDLFKPVQVDLFTNYRYYDESQIKDIELINTLKDVGFTLEEIKNNWNKFNENFFLERKEKLLKEIIIKNEAIKKVDELRSKIHNGKIEKRIETKNTLKKTLF